MKLSIFKNKWVVFFLVVVILIVTIALSSNPSSPLNFIYKAVSVPLQPVQRFFSGAAIRISDSCSYFWNYGTVNDEERVIREENDQLKNTIRELEQYKIENEELRGLLDIIENEKNYNIIASNVITLDTEDWYNVFTIDKGSSSGIKEFDCVITSKGLVGKVISVAPTSAKVMAIVNEESVIMGRLSKSRDIVRIRGSEGTNAYCKLDRIDGGADIAVGDIIETSESGDFYPKGIVLGTVREIIEENSGRYALIETVVDFRRLDTVMVMSSQ